MWVAWWILRLQGLKACFLMFDIMRNGGYSWRKSLEPLFVTRKPAPVRRGFFTPVVRSDCEFRASYGREDGSDTTPARGKLPTVVTRVLTSRPPSCRWRPIRLEPEPSP